MPLSKPRVLASVVGLLVANVVVEARAVNCPAELQLQSRRLDQFLVQSVYPGSAQGAEANPPVNSAYIELKTPFSGQTQTSGSKVEIYGPTGLLTQTIVLGTFSATVGNKSILLATTGFSSTFGTASSWGPDQVVTGLELDLRGGKVCYRSFDTTVPWSDCVAWGNYSGGMGSGGDRVGAGFRPLYGLRRGEAIVRRECDLHIADSNESAYDFVPLAPNPRNQIGYTASFFGFPLRGSCGNDVTEGLEECDDGPRNGDIACSANCQVAICGDTIVQVNAGEDCEPPGTLTCTATCDNIAPECGDGRVNGTDECDDGNDILGDGCANDCTLERCGDGDIQPGAPRNEQCDDGDLDSGDGCSATCRTEYCGDRAVQAGLNETCDDGNTTPGDGCSPTCRTETCGDGVTQSGPPRNEQCDDGNQFTGDGCDTLCREEYCGDGLKQPALEEACDDGNEFADDECNNDCQPNRCGDGIHQARRGEQCDDANQSLGDGCTPDCKREFCGDRIVQEQLGEECDDGNELDDDGCSPECQNERCGDGITQPGRGEECDDRNARDGDGCSRLCIEERCGDGLKQAALNETCDDGNTTAGDGCSATCTTEPKRRTGCAAVDPSALGALALVARLSRRRRR